MRFIERIITLAILLSSITFAQIHIRSINQFTVEDGLSQNSVHSICQDSRGLLWLGTESGINKYDGYQILSYHIFDEQNLFTSLGPIYQITEDNQGGIWYGSMENLSRLDVNTEKAEDVRSLIDQDQELSFGTIMSVYQSSTGDIWFGTFGQGLYKISNDYKSIQNFKNDPENSGDSSLDYIRNFYEDKHGNLWLATYGGLVKFDPTNESFENIFYLSEDSTLRHTTVYKVLHAKNKLYLATNNRGILIYDLATHAINPFDEAINNEIADYNIRDIIQESDGSFWVALYEGGVFHVNPQNGTLSNLDDFIPSEFNEYFSKPLSLLKDKSGVFWVGTQFGGLFKIVLGESYFNTINNKKNRFQSMESNIISTVTADDDNSLWFSTVSGIYKTDPQKELITRLNISEIIPSENYGVHNIVLTKKYAWLSIQNEMIKYDRRSSSYDRILILPSRINEINKISDEELFIGTSQNIAVIYNIVTQEISDTIDFSTEEGWRVALIESYIDDSNNLWVGTYRDLYKLELNNRSKDLTRISLPEQVEYITSMCRLNDDIWFGTYGGGLFSYNINSGKIIQKTIKDGLPDNIIYGVLKDKAGNLWMGSNRGIIQYDLKKDLFKHFTLSDGIQGYEFNSKAFFQSDENVIYYGGINGITYFDPAKIEVNSTTPNTIITYVSLFDSVVASNLSADFNRQFEFSSSQNSLTFEFSALDFTNPLKNNYQYKMEGVNKDWIIAGRKRSATFANMNPGEYRFIVKGSNDDHIFDETGAEFSFVIYPPFYDTVWFKAVLGVLFFIMLYSIYKFRLINQEKRLREIEGIRRKIADDFHDDLGHKLTRISLYSEMMRNSKKFEEDQRTYLDKISEASNSLFYETKDFIWSIDPTQDTIYDVLVYIKDFGDDFFSRTTVAFKVDEVDEAFKKFSLAMKMKREIVLIFKEAMNNVLKHSEASSAELKASVENSCLIVELIDDGSGFNIESYPQSGRGIQSMKKRAAVINGRVDIESSEEGTKVVFVVNLEENNK